MNFLALTIPQAVYDWSGSLLVAVSLVFLIRKNIWYRHFTNLSLIPYFILFMKPGSSGWPGFR
jgi:nicotinamide mononucleotide transporter